MKSMISTAIFLMARASESLRDDLSGKPLQQTHLPGLLQLVVVSAGQYLSILDAGDHRACGQPLSPQWWEFSLSSRR